MNLADAAVILATLLAVAFLLPQIVKLARTGNPEGVSSTWPALGAVTNAGWVAYLSSQHLWPSVPSAAIMVLFYTVILFYLAKAGRGLRSPIVRGIVWAGVLGLILRLGGWHTLGVVLGLAYVVQVTPSVWAAYRSPDPSGIAPSTWWLSVAGAALWMYYGWANADVPIMIFAVTSGVAAALILVRYFITRRADRAFAR